MGLLSRLLGDGKTPVRELSRELPREYRVRTSPKSRPIVEILQRTFLRRYPPVPPTQLAYDYIRPDYGFWDRLRYGLARGYQFGGLFAKPITQILSGFILSDGFQIEYVSDTDSSELNTRLQTKSASIQPFLQKIVEDLLALGDQFIIMDPSGSFRVIPPDIVEKELDPLDVTKVVCYKVCLDLEKVTITDKYYEDRREMTVHDRRDGSITTTVYANQFSRIPIVHLANERGSNELWGRPVYQSLFRLFGRYDDLLERSISGVELSSNPIPVFEGLEDTEEAIELNGDDELDKGSYTEEDGTNRARARIVFDRLSGVILGKGGKFHFASPTVGFTEDVRNMLKVMFLLVLDVSRIPEVVWGGQSSGSHATSGDQMKTFSMAIQFYRAMIQGGRDVYNDGMISDGLIDLFNLWLESQALQGVEIPEGRLSIMWPEVIGQDERIRQSWVQWAVNHNLVDDLEALRQSNLVKDAERTLQKARAEAEKKREELLKTLGEPTLPDETPEEQQEFLRLIRDEMRDLIRSA